MAALAGLPNSPGVEARIEQLAALADKLDCPTRADRGQTG
jgi:hypothetical protein